VPGSKDGEARFCNGFSSRARVCQCFEPKNMIPEENPQ
jgi:hypothetical protein